MEIFCANLPAAVGSDELREVFSEFGTVLECRLATDKTGQSRGFAFLEMDTREALHAIQELNNFQWGNRRLVVTESTKNSR
jgi:RNA recognition motif-containing protein